MLDRYTKHNDIPLQILECIARVVKRSVRVRLIVEFSPTRN